MLLISQNNSTINIRAILIDNKALEFVFFIFYVFYSCLSLILKPSEWIVFNFSKPWKSHHGNKKKGCFFLFVNSIIVKSDSRETKKRMSFLFVYFIDLQFP